MAHSLELDVVAEGVEEAGELAFFREEDVNVIQGYLFSAPVPLEKLRPMLARGYFSEEPGGSDAELVADVIELQRA